MIAFLRAEPGGAAVGEILENRDSCCVAHALNLVEVYYDACRRAGSTAAAAVLKDLESIGVIRSELMTSEFCQAVGKLKAVNRLSLADCCALALAQSLKATLVTSDRHEFGILANHGEFQIQFIR